MYKHSTEREMHTLQNQMSRTLKEYIYIYQRPRNTATAMTALSHTTISTAIYKHLELHICMFDKYCTAYKHCSATVVVVVVSVLTKGFGIKKCECSHSS
jgi:hypothetical protein